MRFCIVFLFLLGSLALQAQKTPQLKVLSIPLVPYEKAQLIQNNANHQSILSGLSEEVAGNDAQDVLRTMSKWAKEIGTDGYDLVLNHVRKGPSGTVYRFDQYYQGLKVYKAQVVVKVNTKNEVSFISNGYVSVPKMETAPTVGASESKRIAYQYLGEDLDAILFDSELLVVPHGNTTTLAYRYFVDLKDKTGEWEVFVDARSGEIISAEDRLYYYKKHDHGAHDHPSRGNNWHPPLELKSTMVMATGTGNIFDPDPLSSSGQSYGGAYMDDNDATNASLDAELVSVTLLDITMLNGVYSLVGPWAEIREIEAPAKGLFSQNSNIWNFNRNDDAFEAVNCYYHIDASMRYINNDLGLPITPIAYTTGVRYDPHGANGADNSYFSSGSDILVFGEGGVDDAEDSDVIHHELGHGLHSWFTNGNLSQVNGLSEGSGDYWCASYNRHLGDWISSDPAYYYTFNWDGHNEFWNGRSVNYRPNSPNSPYPGGLVGQIHTDGQIWATCMMDVWDELGREKTDKIFWDGLSMTGGNTSQDDAANAVYQSAIDMNYTSAELASIYTALTDCGYVLPVTGPPVAEFEADATIICLEDGQAINFSDLSTGNPTSWSWSFPGGNPSTSFMENPTVTYAAAGTYNVTLTATNTYGSNQITKSAYIEVLSGADCPSCSKIVSTDVPQTISASGTPSISSDLDINFTGIITEVKVVDLSGDHSFLGDLDFQLESPSGTSIEIISRKCGSNDDFDISLEDGATSNLPCPYNDMGTYLPDNPLNIFNNEYSYGTWILTINDNANIDGGTLDGWGLDICTQCVTPNNIPQAAGTYIASYECTDAEGWTHYIYDNASKTLSDDLLLLSIKKGGVTVGTVGDGTFEVSVTLEPGYNTGSGIDLSAAGYVTDELGWWVTNRWYDVDPNGNGTGGQIDGDVTVRYYYDDKDIADINGSVTGAGGNPTSASTMTIYKVNAEPPAPTMAVHNLLVYGVDYLEYEPGFSSFVNYEYSDNSVSGLNSGIHRAEYMVSSFSGGGGGAGGASFGALPVEWTYFNIKEVNKSTVELLWGTASEVNNSGYMIEYSAGTPDEWTDYAWIESKNGSVSQDYSSPVVLAPVEQHYFRLRQIDHDGAVQYSKVIKWDTELSDISVYPSLVQNDLWISGASVEDQISLLDTKGTVLIDNISSTHVNMSDYQNGIYFIIVTEPSGYKHVNKILVTR